MRSLRLLNCWEQPFSTQGKRVPVGSLAADFPGGSSGAAVSENGLPILGWKVVLVSVVLMEAGESEVWPGDEDKSSSLEIVLVGVTVDG